MLGKTIFVNRLWKDTLQLSLADATVTQELTSGLQLRVHLNFRPFGLQMFHQNILRSNLVKLYPLQVQQNNPQQRPLWTLLFAA